MEELYADGLLSGLIIIIIGLIILYRVKRAKFWTEKGIKAVAHVTNISDSGMKGNAHISFAAPTGKVWASSDGIIWDLYLTIEQPGFPVRRENIYHRFVDGFEPPQIGDILNILVHPKSPDKFVILPRDMAVQ